MPKQRSNEFDKMCPICGGIIWGKGQRVLIEEAKITVCQNCAQHGIKIRENISKSFKKKALLSTKASQPKRNINKNLVVNEIEIVPEYAKTIRNSRNSLGLNQDQFAQKLNEKPSLLRRIEAGKVEPTIELAKKIEKVYNIKLLQKGDGNDKSVKDSKYMKKSTAASLGDIAFIKKKK